MKKSLIKNFDKIINKIIQEVEKDLLLIDGQNCYYLGPYKILYQNKFYKIKLNNETLYEDIVLIDSVIGIIKYLIRDEYFGIKNIVSYDNNYNNMITNIKYYNNYLDKNKSNNAIIYENRILEDKHKAKFYKDKISYLSGMI